MVNLSTILVALTAATASVALTLVDAHPGGHNHERSLLETATINLFRANAHRSLAACAHNKSMRELQQRAADRRLESIKNIHAERRRLAVTDVVAKDHKSSLTGVTPTNFDAVALFGATPKCVLDPEVTQGPYYVSGELIRNDVRETQPGIDLYAQLQFIDVNTCSPVPDYYVDFWHANATGVYSGVVAETNGDTSDLTNINKTFLRGLYPTDKDGLVQFVTKFPGHYEGRATHMHIVGNHGGSVLPNNTYSGGGAASVGQLFFDQTLLTEVSKTAVYVANTQSVTANSADMWLIAASATGFDPIVEYVYLGDKVEDGVFAWISMGVDLTISKSVGAAATWTANGGVANAGGAGIPTGPGGSGGPGSSGGSGGPGGPPSGSGSGRPPLPSTRA